jgi:hypothetical protein
MEVYQDFPVPFFSFLTKGISNPISRRTVNLGLPRRGLLAWHRRTRVR